MKRALLPALALIAGISAPALAHDLHDGHAALEALSPSGTAPLTWPQVRKAVRMHYHSLTSDTGLAGTPDPADDDVTDPARAAASSHARHVNPDHDAALSLTQYRAIAKRRFRQADADHDGSLTEAEMDSPAGRSLLRMMAKPSE